jgi:type IV pilus assembly protein PilV
MPEMRAKRLKALSGSPRQPVSCACGLRCRDAGNRPSGFSLVEVLVALLLLAIGLLGTATLLLEALASERVALERSRAVTLASDMLERIRANREAGGLYDTASGIESPERDPTCEQPAGGCRAEIMASHDLRNWLDAIEAQLPSGVGTVEVAPVGPGRMRFTVRIAWARSDTGQASVYMLEAET